MNKNTEMTNALFPKWKKQVKVYNDAIKALETIKPLADKFDGKVINKRFKDALNDICKDIDVAFSIDEKGYNRYAKVNEKIIVMRLTDRSFPTSEVSCGYIDEDRFEIWQVDNEKFYINGDGRLAKDIFIQAVDRMIDVVNERIAQYQDCIDNFDAYMDEVRKVNETIKALGDKLHYPMTLQTLRLELPFWYK